MPLTTRAALRYPLLTDAPNGPVMAQNLAEDVDAQLYRALPCTSSTRPAAPPIGMVIRETDTGLFLGWSGSTWDPIGAGAALAVETTTADATYSAAGTQSVGQDINVILALAQGSSTTNINRNVRGAGHEFVLAVGGLWAVGLTCRWQQNPAPPAAPSGANGELRAGLYTAASPTEPVVEFGGDYESSPSYTSLSVTKRFTAGTTLYVQLFNSSGVNRTLDRGANGSTVRLHLALVGR